MSASPLRDASAPLLFALALLLSPPVPAQDAGGPRAVVPEPMWDAGHVARGGKISHDFVLRNEGSAVLHVREVQATCGCTVASFDETVLPGGTGTVRVELDTETFRGPVTRDVTVLTSDPGNPSIVLTVRAEVHPAVDAVPGYFRFLHVQGAAAPTIAQTVWSPDFAGLEVTDARSPLPALEVTVRPATAEERTADPDSGASPEGRQWVVRATLASEAPTGPIEGDVVVRTNHPQQPELRIPIGGYVRPTLMATPPRVEFGTFAPSEPRKGSVVVNNHGEAAVRVLGVESDVPGLSAQVAEREKGKRFDVNLTLAAGLAPGPIAGTLRVRTDSPRTPVLEIPVKGRVQ